MPQARSTKQICHKFDVLLYPFSWPVLFVFLCKPLITLDIWLFYFLYQKAISLLGFVVLWFLHCVFIRFLLSFLSPCHLSMGGKGSSNFRLKLIYISHTSDICLTSLINYLHWKGWIMKLKLKIMSFSCADFKMDA